MSRSYFAMAAALSTLAGLMPTPAAQPSRDATSHVRASVTWPGGNSLPSQSPARDVLLMLAEFEPLEPVVRWDADGRASSIAVKTDQDSWIDAIPTPGAAPACLLALGALLPAKPSRRLVRCSCCGRWCTAN